MALAFAYAPTKTTSHVVLEHSDPRTPEQAMEQGRCAQDRFLIYGVTRRGGKVGFYSIGSGRIGFMELDAAKAECDRQEAIRLGGAYEPGMFGRVD